MDRSASPSLTVASSDNVNRSNALSIGPGDGADAAKRNRFDRYGSADRRAPVELAPTSRLSLVARLAWGVVAALAVAALAAGCSSGDGGVAGDDADATDSVAEDADGDADAPEGTDEADGPSASDGDDGAGAGADDGANPGGDDGDGGAGDGDGGGDAGGENAPDDGAGPDPSIEVPDWVEVVGVDEALNVRAGPSSSFDRVAQIPPGETLRVLGGAESAEGGLWLQVVIGGETEGWVFAQYTSRIARPTPTPLPLPTPVGTPTPLPTGDDTSGGSDDGDDGPVVLRVVAPDGLNLRDGPGLDTDVIAELDDGDRVEATGRTEDADGRDWTEVRVGGRTGWVAAEFVRPVG